MTETTGQSTKAAVLLFIRQANVTDIVAKAAETLATHPRCKRDFGGNEERHDNVFQAIGDPHREIHLVLLPFALPGTDK